MSEVDVELISPRGNVIAVKLKDSHYLRCSDLAAISAFEPIKSLGEHSVTVCGDGEHFEPYRSDERCLLKRINERYGFVDTGRGGNALVDPDCARSSPLLNGNSTAILGMSGKKAVTFSMGVGMTVSFE
ncbi:hypothetical protein [Pseudomonas fluorescens]|uniref:hypothetical protein n=1 Tax=Pseudomonas fluorescens TaxID=294 RepID=UPI003EBC3655